MTDGANKHIRYVLLCDYGLDDAAATVYLLDSRKKGDAVDILPIGGNSEKSVAYRNAHTLLANYGGDLSGVRIVDTRALVQPYAALPSVHGSDGMGDLFPAARSKVAEISFDEWMNADIGEYVLVSLGPCTVTRLILEGKPAPAHLLIMGGNVASEPNFEGREFNHALDVSAFAYSVARQHTIATLDSCRHPIFNLVVSPQEGSALLKKLTARALELASARHPDNCYVYDLIAVRSLFERSLMTVTRAVDPDGNVLNMLSPREA